MSTVNVRPTNGVSYGVRHTVTAEDATDTAAVAEVVTLTVTAACSADGDVTVTLPSTTGVAIAVTTAASTTDAVATLIRAGDYTGWTPGGINAVVTFTRTVAGDVTGTPTFDGATTGVTATITVTTEGADAVDGYVQFDFRNGTNYRYPLVAIAQVLNSSNVVTMPADLTITYPSDGVVRVNGTLVEDSIVNLIAQRADS